MELRAQVKALTSDLEKTKGRLSEFEKTCADQKVCFFSICLSQACVICVCTILPESLRCASYFLERAESLVGTVARALEGQ